jgi:inhibitor of KinA
VYPIDTPGGWHLIGRTHQPLVRLSDTIDLTLPLGSRVRFTPISYAESLTLENAR